MLLLLLLFSDGPVIECESGAAYLNEINIYLRCEIDSRPPPSYIYWVIDNNDTIVTDGETIGDYRVLILVNSLLHSVSVRTRLSTRHKCVGYKMKNDYSKHCGC